MESSKMMEYMISWQDTVLKLRDRLDRLEVLVQANQCSCGGRARLSYRKPLYNISCTNCNKSYNGHDPQDTINTWNEEQRNGDNGVK
jgi:hypothetical protein